MTFSLTPGATPRWGPPVKQFKIEVALAFTNEEKHCQCLTPFWNWDPISEGPDQYIIEWRRPGLTWSLWNSFLGRHGPHLRSTPAAPSDRKFLPAWVERLQAGLRPEVWLPSTITNKMVWDGFDPANQEQGRIYDQLPRGWRRSWACGWPQKLPCSSSNWWLPWMGGAYIDGHVFTCQHTSDASK